MESIKEKILYLIKEYSHLNNTQIAKKFIETYGSIQNIEAIRKKVSRLRKKMNQEINDNKDPKVNFTDSESNSESKWTETSDSATIEVAVKGHIIKNLDEALEFSKVDLNVWEVEKHIFNTWTTSAKALDGSFMQINNVQVKIWFKRRTTTHFNEADLVKQLISNYKPSIQLLKKSEFFEAKDFNKPSGLLISMTDFHLDKRTIDGKTIQEKVNLYEKTIDNLLKKAYNSHYIDEIIYMASSDFMHTDNYQEATTKGTPQQSSVTWYDAYEIGFDLQARTIAKLKQFCNKLVVIHIPSNHSRTKEYYMIHALAHLYRNNVDIIFDRTAEPSKAYQYGNTALFFHHGDIKNINQLPQYMASKFKNLWGNTQYAEILTGDKHVRKGFKQSLIGEELNGTRVFTLPSMSGPDIWHKDSLYDLAIQSSVARVYDKEKGFCTEFEERI